MNDSPAPWHVHLHIELSPTERKLARAMAWVIPGAILLSAIIEGHL